MLLEIKMIIKNSMFDYIRYKLLNWYSHMRGMNEEEISKNFGMVFIWKKKKETSKLMDAGITIGMGE